MSFWDRFRPRPPAPAPALQTSAVEAAAPAGDVVPRTQLLEAHREIRTLSEQAGRLMDRADTLESILSNIGDPDALLPFATRQAQSLFRSIGKGKETDRDLMQHKRAEVLRLAHQAYAFRGDAENILQAMIDFIIGDGFEPKAKDSKDAALQKALEEIWEDPRNGLDENHADMVLSLLLEGERFALAELSEQDGRLEIAYVPPESVVGVVQDARRRDVLLAVKRPDPGTEPWEYFILDNLSKDIEISKLPAEDPKGNRYQIAETLVDEATGASTVNTRVVRGLAFAWFINRPEGASRGRSELTAVLDYIGAHDELLWAQQLREKLQNLFVLDVSIEGANTKDEVDLRLQEMGLKQPPQAPKVIGHNEKVTVELMRPDLQAGQKNELERTLAVNIYGAKGMPEHFRGSGGDSNLATAQAQDVLPMKRLRRKQRRVACLFKRMIEIQLELKRRAGVGKAEGEFEIISTEVGGKDKARGTTIVKDLVAALATAVGEQVLKPEAANAIIVQALREAGYEIDEKFAELPEGADMAIVEKMVAELAGAQPKGGAGAPGDRAPRGDPQKGAARAA